MTGKEFLYLLSSPYKLRKTERNTPFAPRHPTEGFLEFLQLFYVHAGAKYSYQTTTAFLQASQFVIL
jgi:hypothetical protein